MKNGGDFPFFGVSHRLFEPHIGVPRFDALALDMQWERVANDIVSS
jgi:hypothetical protein